ncbi:MAG TPA: hypothetical protein VF181_03165 [Balneolaceae bacterium]
MVIQVAVFFVLKTYDLIFNELQEIPVLFSSAESGTYKAGALVEEAFVFLALCGIDVYLWEKFQALKRLKAI